MDLFPESIFYQVLSLLWLKVHRVNRPPQNSNISHRVCAISHYIITTIFLYSIPHHSITCHLFFTPQLSNPIPLPPFIHPKHRTPFIGLLNFASLSLKASLSVLHLRNSHPNLHQLRDAIFKAIMGSTQYLLLSGMNREFLLAVLATDFLKRMKEAQAQQVTALRSKADKKKFPSGRK